MWIRFVLAGALVFLGNGSLWAQRIQAEMDQFGNPVGEDFGLAGREEFKGKRLLVWTAEPEVEKDIFPDNNPLWIALKKKGFEVTTRHGPFDPRALGGFAQLWLFSGRSAGLDEQGYEAVVQFVKKGKGLYLVADNAPYLQDADVLARRLFNAGLAGDYQGGQLVAVRHSEIGEGDSEESRARSQGSPRGRQGSPSPSSPRIPGRASRIEASVSHTVADHALLTDINFIFEGMTISHIVDPAQLHVVLTASDGQALAAVARDRRYRVVVDCGFTRYYCNPPQDFVNKTAGTIRYAENIAAYLMGKDSKRPTLSSIRGDTVSLLEALKDPDASYRKKVLEELGKTSPKYSEVAEQLDQIIELFASEDKTVAAAARGQLANAFQRAPLAHCLHWLGQGDEPLVRLIWEQIDGRIRRADAQRRAGYVQTALSVLAEKQYNLATRRAAIELLGRLKDHQAVPEVIELLLRLPAELQPRAGDLLRDLTGQSFGPRSGAGIAEVLESQKRWQAWWKSHSQE